MQDRIVAEAVRIEYEEKSGKMYIVFAVKDEKYKQDLRKTCTKDIEFSLVDRYLGKEYDE